MLFLFLGCFGLSFKKWTEFQYGGLKNRQDFRMAGFTGLFTLSSTGCCLDRMARLQGLQNC